MLSSVLLIQRNSFGLDGRKNRSLKGKASGEGGNKDVTQRPGIAGKRLVAGGQAEGGLLAADLTLQTTDSFRLLFIDFSL